MLGNYFPMPKHREKKQRKWDRLRRSIRKRNVKAAAERAATAAKKRAPYTASTVPKHPLVDRYRSVKDMKRQAAKGKGIWLSAGGTTARSLTGCCQNGPRNLKRRFCCRHVPGFYLILWMHVIPDLWKLASRCAVADMYWALFVAMPDQGPLRQIPWKAAQRE